MPDPGEEGLPLRAPGLAGAAVVQREIEVNAGGVIGIGDGRARAAPVVQMPCIAACGVRFVSLPGDLARNVAAIDAPDGRRHKTV